MVGAADEVNKSLKYKVCFFSFQNHFLVQIIHRDSSKNIINHLYEIFIFLIIFFIHCSNSKLYLQKSNSILANHVWCVKYGFNIYVFFILFITLKKFNTIYWCVTLATFEYNYWCDKIRCMSMSPLSANRNYFKKIVRFIRNKNRRLKSNLIISNRTMIDIYLIFNVYEVKRRKKNVKWNRWFDVIKK